MMTGMKRRFAEISVWLGIFMLNCTGPVELDGPIRDRSSFSGGGSAGSGTAGDLQTMKSLYVTGVEYPPGYDWRPDLGSGAAGAKIFLMKDGVRTVEADVGYDNCISADADMHRCIEGHLYTDFSTETETVVKCDGREIFRFFGREMIVGMLVRNDGTYTLGKPRSGSGWAFRKNGEIVLYKGAGEIVSELHQDGGNIYFAYEDVFETSSGTTLRYYLVTNGTPQPIASTDDVTGIDDVRMSGGTLHYIARMDKLVQSVLFSGPDGKAYPISPGSAMRGGKLFLSESGTLFTHAEILSGGRYQDAFWRGTDGPMILNYPAAAAGFCADGNNFVFSAKLSATGLGAEIFDGQTMHTLPSEYDLIYDSAIAADNGRCCAAIVSRADGGPALWINGDIRKYDFNGAFTSVSYW